jgi:hypothetical protein
MRQAYAHYAVLTPGTDPEAVEAVLGRVAVRPDGDQLRILFVTEPGRVDEVRDRIDAALAAGPWELSSSGCARIGAEDRDHARRLLRSR